MVMKALRNVFEGFEVLKDCLNVDSEIQPIGSKSPLPEGRCKPSRCLVISA